MRTCLTAGVLVALVGLAGCGGSNAIDLPPAGSGNGGPPDAIAWGPRLADSGLSALAGADDAGRAERWVAIFPRRRGRPHGRRGVGARDP